jgi:hypothetical protein
MLRQRGLRQERSAQGRSTIPGVSLFEKKLKEIAHKLQRNIFEGTGGSMK